ncbi:MAG: DoxX family membrane protein [Muribaculaceae bacterium]|nr:DoxX family membrane protein [Muribaculaceae bacterium]
MFTWLCRIIVGSAFILGGWAKCVDPYGTLYKMLEYIHAWGMYTMPREPVVMAAVALGVAELTIGVCCITGVLRHSAAVAATAVMCFMLPLTGYIAIANPVSDCGCFGDLLILSNTATFIKNIVLMAACVWLLLRNNCCHGLFMRQLQWLPLVATAVYALVLAAIGYNVQPVVDFRPYPVGTVMTHSGDDEITALEYSRDGVTRTFDIDELPDSTWSYLGPVVEPGEGESGIAVFDSEGEEADIFETEGTQLIFVVPDPGEHFLTRARFANELARYASLHGVESAAIVGTSASGIREWSLLAAPEFDVYSADDTDLKTLVRGDIAAVYLHDGKIVWKRNLASLDTDIADYAAPDVNALDMLDVPDNGTLATVITAVYIVVLMVGIVVTATARIMRRRQ